MRLLYHNPPSTFSRRVRLALAHKGLDVELRDASIDAVRDEAHRLSPLRTRPLLVDEGRVIGDSTAICQYLDVAYPDRARLWPTDAAAAAEALTITTLVDVAVDALADLGTRYFELRNDPAWPAVSTERMARAQAAIDTVAELATRPLLAGDSWGAAEIWTLSATVWVDALPERAKTTPRIARIISLGFKLPDALRTWAKQHTDRPDVRSVYA